MERLELAGVPVFFEEGAEPAFASLMFRAGIADEPPTRRGVTHLIEHLALFPFERRDHPYNGFVDQLTCTFYAHGNQSELEQFLRDVAGSLAALPFERLQAEKHVLQREADAAGADVVSRLLAYRYGMRGYGAGLLSEVGLRWLGVEHIESWRCERFTRANAVVWMHGRKPPELELELGDGNRLPPPKPAVLQRLSLPAFVAEGSGDVALGMAGERTWATTIALDLAWDALRERVRIQRGLTYEPWSDYEALGNEVAHVCFGAQCRDADAGQVAEAALEVVDGLGERGPTQDDLDTAKRRAERSIREDPERERSALHAAAFAELIGSPHQSPAEGLDELRALTREGIQAVMHRARSTLLVVAPEGTTKPSDAPAELDRPPVEIEGRRFPAKGIRQEVELIIGEAGIKWSSDDTVIAIPADEVNMVIEDSGGELTVSGADGSWIEIDPAYQREPDATVEALRRLTADPFVPSLDERAGWVKRLAEEKLERQWVVREELSLLPDVLEPEERPMNMAVASLGLRSGLLVVSEQRVLFLYAGLRRDDLLRFPLSEVRARRPRRPQLFPDIVLETEGERLKFQTISPRARADELVEAIGS